MSTSLSAAPARRVLHREATHIVGREGPRTASLLDTRLVRAELARLRAPRAATTVYRARAIGSTNALERSSAESLLNA